MCGDLSEHALGQLDSHGGFSTAAYAGLARPTVGETAVPRGRTSVEPPGHPPPAREPAPRPPTRSLKGASASHSGSRGPDRSETRATLFPQRNPSAAGRELVLITPHPQ